MSLIHRYQNNGMNIVLDINSGCVHVVDEVTWQVLPFLEEGLEEETITERLKERFSPREIHSALSECRTLTEQGMLSTKDISISVYRSQCPFIPYFSIKCSLSAAPFKPGIWI